MNANEIYKLYIEKECRICTDSRSKEIENSVFFAIKGTEFNGNDFAVEALNKGALVSIIDNPNIKHESCILVQDVLETLQKIASIHRTKYKIPFIAITGSNGKTTTKEILTQLLSSKYNTLSTQGNFNNHIGLPMTILSLRKHHEIAIIEMGANHIGEIKKLCEISQPTHGIITNIGSAHIGEFGGIKNIIKAKKELFDYLKQNDKCIIYNEMDIVIKNLVNNYKNTEAYRIPIHITKENYIQSFSFSYKCDPFISINYTKVMTIKTNIIGNYNINNIICAIKTATLFNINNEKIQTILSKIELKNNRSQFIQTEKNDIVLDAYNANPTSMSASILNFIEINMHLKYQKMLFILGDMLELGKEEVKYHQEIINLLEKNNITECILVGKIFSQARCISNYKKVNNIDEVLFSIEKSNIQGYSVLIKGSRKLKLEKITRLL
tara:strand:- start:447 stop:1763 length:1317 start_codon:yes stop_codon:yes gene_type:complete